MLGTIISIAAVVSEVGVSALVSNVAATMTLTSSKPIITKAAMGVGSFVLGAMAGEAASSYVKAKGEGLVAGLEKVEEIKEEATDGAVSEQQ